MKAGWEVRTLGELCEFRRGLTYAKGDEVDSGGTAVLRAMNIDLDTGELNLDDVRYIAQSVKVPKSKMVEAGTILICTASGSKKHLGKTAIVDQPMDFAFGGFMGLLVPSKLVLPKFLQRIMRSDPYWEFIEQLSSGTNINNLKFSQLSDFAIPLPPLEEQQRIVAILDEAFEGLDRARANAEANLQNARELFSVAIEASLERAGGTDYTLARLLEKNWILSHLDGNHGSNYPRKEEFVAEGVPYISANCIDGDIINLNRCKFLPPARADTLRKGTAKNRDVIFAHNATVGPVALLQTDEPRILLSTSLTHYRCNEDYISPEFLVFAMRSAGFKRQYEAVMGQATRNQVPITIQRTFTHKIPSMDEQLKIAELGKDIERATRELAQNYELQRNNVDEICQSLLRKAFAGELI